MFDNDDTNSELEFYVVTFLGFLAIGGVAYFLPALIAPFGLFDLWTIKGSLWEAAWKAWPLYLWGMLTTIDICISEADRLRAGDPMKEFVDDTLISIRAGFVEEIAFRWLAFLAGLIAIYLVDWAIFSISGVRWLRGIFEPICQLANWLPTGNLSTHLLGEHGWTIAAAIIGANVVFCVGHTYQGFWGCATAWVGGLYLFWVVFDYGLLAAIGVHFLYNFVICLTSVLGLLIARERKFH